LATPAVQNNFN